MYKIFDEFSDLPITNQQRYDLRHPNYMKEWKLNHPNYDKKYDKTHREQRNANKRIYRLRHPKIEKAHNLAKYHIPLGKMCQFGNCDATKNLNRCHLDYDYPLLVITMCQYHHNLIDRLYREND